MSVKFCSDIRPSQSQNFEFIMQQAFKKMFEDRFINEFFSLFFGREMKKISFNGEFPNIVVSGQPQEVTTLNTVVLCVTFSSTK